MGFRKYPLKLGIIYLAANSFLSLAQEDALYQDGVKINTLTNKEYLKKFPLPVASEDQTQNTQTESGLPANELASPTSDITAEIDSIAVAGNKEKIEDKGEELITVHKGKFSLMAFYTASKGDFEETATNGSAIETEQNSPATLGLFGNYRPHLAHYSWQGSIYGSMLKGTQTTYSQQVDPPMEFGTNLYWQYEVRAMQVSLGFDYERFSNYSAENVDANGTASIKNQSVTFATLGVGRFFPIKDWNLLTKFSLSTSVASSDFGGQKGILYLGLFSPWKWQIHALYKLHKLENDTGSKLTINRFGIGIGYLFF